MQIDMIDPKKTAMVVVDMQNDFVAPGAAMETPAARAVVPKIADALKICRDAGIKVIYTAHVHRRDGSAEDPRVPAEERTLTPRAQGDRCRPHRGNGTAAPRRNRRSLDESLT